MADERIDPSQVHPIVWADHIHRYAWASQYCKGLVVDVACGAGYGSERILTQAAVEAYLGIDVAWEAAHSGSRLFGSPSTRFIQSHGGRLPLANASVDTVISFETLEHVDAPEELIAEIARVLKPSGLFIGSVPSAELEELTNQIYGKNPFHRTRFPRVNLSRLLAQQFVGHQLYEQSLEIVSLMRPDAPTAPQGLRVLNNPRYEHWAPGCLTFIAAKTTETFDRLDAPSGSASLVPAVSLMAHEQPTNEYVRGLVQQLDETEKSRVTLAAAQAALEQHLNHTRAELEQRLAEAADREARQADQIATLLSELVAASNERHSLQRETELIRSQAEFDQNELKRQLVNEQQLASTFRMEVENIRATRSYRLVQRIVHSPAKAFVVAAGRALMPDRLRRSGNGVTVEASIEPTLIENRSTPVVLAPTERPYSPDEENWINALASRPRPVSVGHPDWIGIRSAAAQLFDTNLYAKDNLDEAEGKRLAHLLIDGQCQAAVIQGFPRTYIHLVRALRKDAPNIPVFIIWHGSFVQARLDYDWEVFEQVAELCRDGYVRKWGFVKKGMAEIMAAAGYRTGFVMNRVKAIPQGPSVVLDSGPHIGVWGLWQDNWLKPPFAMLAAARLIQNATVHSSVISERVRSFTSLLGVTIQGTGQPIAPNDMPLALSQMHLNLYVSLSECAPMVPLESLSAGAPCLFGPNSHYFEDHDYLRSQLIVPHPDNAHMIAEYANRALAERAAIIRAYMTYAPEYNRKAEETLRSFLEIPLP